jgi:hypothetical protein
MRFERDDVGLVTFTNRYVSKMNLDLLCQDNPKRIRPAETEDLTNHQISCSILEMSGHLPGEVRKALSLC